jgi:hypothetical protein
MRVLSCVVIVSAAITVWTRAALVFALGPQLTSAILWIAAGGSLCAVLTLTGTRKQGRRQHRSPQPAARYPARGDCDRTSAARTAREPRRQGHNRARGGRRAARARRRPLP